MGLVVLIMQIKFPLFVRAKDSGEIARFDSIQEFQNHVEKIDIENEEYEAWDNDGLPVQIKLQEPALWIRVEPAAEEAKPEQLRSALFKFAEAVGIQLPDELSPDSFATTVDRIQAEQEKDKLRKSRVRRFFSRFKQPLDRP
jgi:hypothetical protein